MYILQIIEKSHEVIPVIYESWIPLVLAGASLAMGAYSTYKKNKASNDLRNAQSANLRKQQGLSDYYQSELNRDFFTTDVAKGAVDRLTKQLKSANKKTADKVSKSGATQEAKVAAKGENLGRFSDAMGRISGYGVNYKNNMGARYEGMLNKLYAGNTDHLGRDVQSYGNLQSNSFNALSQSLGSLDAGDTSNPDLFVKKEEGGES